MASNNIDCKQAEPAVRSLNSEEQHSRYQPRTLTSHNSARYVYLPLFPTKSFGPNDCLLLANVPVSQLGTDDLDRREHGTSTVDAQMLLNDYDYSNDGFSLSEQDAERLATRLRVGQSIVTFNAARLRGICHSLLALLESFRRHVLLKTDIALAEPVLNSKQMAMALEFFLQIDVDLFYMKTCSFRGAHPRPITEGLFCGENEPQARYSMLACRYPFCSCCDPLYQWKKSDPWSVVDFASSSSHQFVNGYTTYLNCPATCHSSNIIYTLTCPCGHYDYVDSTAETLPHAMAYHRNHGNRIIHEKLTGSPLFQGMILDPEEREKAILRKMRLYQHSIHCPIALRSFLDCNPTYWCFVPMLWNDVLEENVDYVRESSNLDVALDSITMIGAHADARVARFFDRVPIPPAPYGFSYRQRRLQRLFFEALSSSSMEPLPYSTLDLYKVAIIAVLPDSCSKILRYIIETLFIIHGEPKLNMLFPTSADPIQRRDHVSDQVWCANLNRRSADI